MTASPPPPVSPLVRALLDVREILERARRTGDQREIETAVEAVAERAPRAFLPPPGVSPPETVAPAPATPTSLPQVAPESPAQIELEPDIGIGEAAYKMASADLMRRSSPRIPAQPTPGNSPSVWTRGKRLAGHP